MFSWIVVWLDYDFIVVASPTQLAKRFCGSVVGASYLSYEGVTFSLPDSEVRPSHLSYHLFPGCITSLKS